MIYGVTSLCFQFALVADSQVLQGVSNKNILANLQNLCVPYNDRVVKKVKITFC